ncbi:MAG: hypothetical protein WDM70_02710 [Nitrosomonadales bacterium]
MGQDADANPVKPGDASDTQAGTLKVQAAQTADRTRAELSAYTKLRSDASMSRSMIATVLFFDVVGYTKQSVSKQIELKGQFNSLVSDFIRDIEENQRIILDTGDGAALASCNTQKTQSKWR